MRKYKGFTIIEFFIVVAIIIIIAAIAIPRFMKARDTNFPRTLTLYSQEECEEVISAFKYYNKYRESMIMNDIIRRIE